MQVEFTHLFSTTKCIQTGHPYRLSVAQRTGLGLSRTSSNTSDSNSIRSSARTGDTCSLLKHDAEKRKKSWSQHGSITTAYTSLVGVSDMRMNRNRNRNLFNGGIRV